MSDAGSTQAPRSPSRGGRLQRETWKASREGMPRGAPTVPPIPPVAWPATHVGEKGKNDVGTDPVNKLYMCSAAKVKLYLFFHRQLHVILPRWGLDMILNHHRCGGLASTTTWGGSTAFRTAALAAYRDHQRLPSPLPPHQGEESREPHAVIVVVSPRGPTA